MTVSNHIFWLLLIAILLIGIAIVLAYWSRREAVVAALASLLLAKWSGYITLDTGSMWFWIGASIIVIGINILLPRQVSTSRIGLPYFATGALTGAVIGMLFNSIAGVICATAAGVAIAAIAFCRLPQGSVLGFPSRKFFNYLCAKGLPLVVIFSMLGIVCLQLIIMGAAYE